MDAGLHIGAEKMFKSLILTTAVAITLVACSSEPYHTLSSKAQVDDIWNKDGVRVAVTGQGLEGGERLELYGMAYTLKGNQAPWVWKAIARGTGEDQGHLMVALESTEGKLQSFEFPADLTELGKEIAVHLVP